jgi:hypothetical protein
MKDAQRNEILEKIDEQSRELELAMNWFSLVERCNHNTPDRATVDYIRRIATNLQNIALEIILISDEYKGPQNG